ncbi:unnamed protein product, partial [Rotaria sordida]
MEEEVRHLFQADYEAIDLEWEVIYDDDQQIEGHTDLFGGVLSQSDEEETSQK